MARRHAAPGLRNAARIPRHCNPMRRLSLELIAAMAITLAAIVASAHGVMANGVMVTNAFARASAIPTAAAGVVYASIANRSAVPDQLLAITTPAASMAEVHETKDANGTASMLPVAILDIPAASTVELKPGGLHIMLMQLKAPLKQGATVHLDFIFAKAGTIGIDVPVKGVAATAP